MDKRSWPWKKKSSEKAAAAATDSTTGSQSDQSKKEEPKKTKYVQISAESYSHLTGLEDQLKSYEEKVKSLEEEVEELNEMLSAARSEMTNKDNMVKQHAKVAEEAVSGWEKAEAEASALKSHLESVTLQKLTAEDRASHLDGALKECMRQVRNLKEEHEQNLQEVALNKKKQFDKMKLELESKISDLDQEFLRCDAENAALSRSLQERSNMLIKLSEEKSEAEAEIGLLKNNIKSCEKEINSLKYELHVATKELEIRNEEKNMSVRSAEVANKQHLEGVRKIAKLEAECQRLRGLVRKKLPGPAALAQMKLEVENLGRETGGTRLRRSPVKPNNPQMSMSPELSLDSIQKYQKENEILTECLLAMEEETKMLKEALTKSNSELQASRSICAKTTDKLQSMEAQLLYTGEHRTLKLHRDGTFCQNAYGPPSLVSFSEDGNDEDVSCSGSWTKALISEVSHFQKERSIDSSSKVETASHLELMDDFLEMEKLACQSNDSNGALPSSVISSNLTSENVIRDMAKEVTTAMDFQLKESLEPNRSEKQAYPSVDGSALDTQADEELPPLMKLKSTIAAILESISRETEKLQFLEDVRCILQDIGDVSSQQSSPFTAEASQSLEAETNNQTSPDYVKMIAEKEVSLSTECRPNAKSLHSITQEVVTAMSEIQDVVLLMGKEAKAVHGTSPDGDRLSKKLDRLSATCNAVVNSGKDLSDFVLDLSLLLNKASELKLYVPGYKGSETEAGSSDCIDKVALPEEKDIQDLSEEKCTNGCPHFSDSASEPDMAHEGNPVPTSESRTSSWKCSLEEFEQLKQEKDNMLRDLARCTEDLESTKSQLHETEQHLAEVKSQLTSAQKINSLAETQLKCMTESYKSLETRAEELQTEINLLHTKIESLDNDLQEERRNHQDALSKYKDLEEQLQRMEGASLADTDAKANQERELAEKLAECQETIFLLGKQLKAFRPQTEIIGSPFNEKKQKDEGFSKDESTNRAYIHDVDPGEMNTNLERTGSESPRHPYHAPPSPYHPEASNLLRSPISSKPPKPHPTKSGSSLTSSTPEKHSRGFGRFFSSKGKTGN